MKEKNYDYWLDCDYVSGACYCYENAVKHYKISEILAGQKNYGFAISHLILGAEELIKALIMVKLNTERYFIEDKQKEELFKTHSFKHINIREFLKSLTSEEIDDYYENWFDLLNPSESKNKFRQTGFFLSRTIKLGSIGEEEITEIDNLIQNANNLKNRGLYVDYRNNWILPDDIKEPTYMKYTVLIGKLRKYIEPLFTMPLGDNEVTNFIYGI